MTKCTKFTFSALTQTDISYEQKSDSHYWHHGWKIMPYQDSGIKLTVQRRKTPVVGVGIRNLPIKIWTIFYLESLLCHIASIP
jgi:hypothetical protein